MRLIIQGNMKKIVLILIFISSMFLITSCNKNTKNKDNIEDKRYEEIKKDFEDGLKWKIKATYPNGCFEEDYHIGTTTSSYLINQGYIKKEILLDVDGKSYCKANAKTSCKDGEIVYNIYLKCNNYVTDGYEDWK